MRNTLLCIVLLLLPVISLAAENSSTFRVQDVYVLSDIDKGLIEVRIWLEETTESSGQPASADTIIEYPDGMRGEIMAIPLERSVDKTYFFFTSAINPVITWEPRDVKPALYHLEMTLRDQNGKPCATVFERFGMRKFETRGPRFFINNSPFFLRACGHEEENIFRHLDREASLKRLIQVKRYGFNAVRHHSHVPDEEYLKVADELGILIQMEIHGKIGTDLDSERFRDSQNTWIEMIKQGRRHPSSFIYSMGNEIYQNDPGLIECQNSLYDIAKKMDPAVLVLNRSGSNPFNDAFGTYDLIERPIGEYEHVAEFARESFMLYLRGERKGRSDEFPIIAHEYPLVASYPNPALSHKYPEEPFWLKLTVENARSNNLEHLLLEFVRNSEKIQTLCRKEMLEEARKFSELDGYSMLRFTDNEDKVSGVVDDFADPKNVTAEEFLRTNGETVLLCTWNKRSFMFGETLNALLEISHHGKTPFTADKCRWWLLHDSDTLTSGMFSSISVDPVDVTPIGGITVVVPQLFKPSKLLLRADIPDTRPYIMNEWNFWAFPEIPRIQKSEKIILLLDPRRRLSVFLDAYPDFQYHDTLDFLSGNPIKAALILTDSWHEAFYDFLEQGGRVWVISDKTWPWPEEIGIFGMHITHFIPEQQSPTIFPEFDELCNKWLTICSNSKSRYGNSGTIISTHPALADFPHEGFCDLHLWPLIYRAKTLDLGYFPANSSPIFRAIDNYYRGVSKGYMIELGIGKGNLLVTTLNFTQSFPRDVASQYLFSCLLNYMKSNDAEPAARMTADELKRMLDSFATDYSKRPPLTHSEMPARYTTRWKSLLSPYELIPLPIYDAHGIEQSRLGVHYEYAQTQWYFNARPGDSLQWEFSNETDAEFKCIISIASSLDAIPLTLIIDDSVPLTLSSKASSGWEHFIPLEVNLPGRLLPGIHLLQISLPQDAPTADGVSLRIMDIELRSLSTQHMTSITQ